MPRVSRSEAISKAVECAEKAQEFAGPYNNPERSEAYSRAAQAWAYIAEVVKA